MELQFTFARQTLMYYEYIQFLINTGTSYTVVGWLHALFWLCIITVTTNWCNQLHKSHTISLLNYNCISPTQYLYTITTYNIIWIWLIHFMLSYKIYKVIVQYWHDWWLIWILWLLLLILQKQKVIFYNIPTAHIHHTITSNTTNIHAVDKEYSQQLKMPHGY